MNQAETRAEDFRQHQETFGPPLAFRFSVPTSAFSL